MNISLPPGVFDIIPLDENELWRSSYLWNFVEATIRETAAEWGYQEIRTPIFEKTELFLRGVGEGTDIVSKEMYTFQDKGDRSLTLRPEGTAPAMRALIENRLDLKNPVQKLFYIQPMFRYERAQAGRYRQHHQFGVEAIGIKSPYQDAELIDMIYTLYRRLGLQDLSVKLNSLGDPESRKRYKEVLIKYLESHREKLSNDSKERLTVNPLRVLDSKAEEDQPIIENAPSILEFLSDEASMHFEKLKSLLTELSIPFTIAPRLVRGLDYYNYTVFEIVTNSLGAQNSIAGGGRYDGLIKSLGGPDLPSCGFGTGMERIIQTMLKQSTFPVERPAPLLTLIPMGEAAELLSFKFLHLLREKGISAEMEMGLKKVGKAMSRAEKNGSKYVAVLGETELETQKFRLKEMETGEQFEVNFESALRILLLQKESASYERLWANLNSPFQSDVEKEFFLKKMNQSITCTNEASSNLKIALEKMQEIFDKPSQ
ncbi:histidine--tRNA ligase [Estrella lausannensis]|uniref:Histidine--tRNA ligase n=1 Tax=Estrella lausannensis TaxID=483423 RepID=A0A0H5DPD3_9BACT|nr:histidine--tRNA ligase [Estrella lausannensis]CRX37823.1 histidyl-tRNA synthetase [Estrella lausannensis]